MQYFGSLARRNKTVFLEMNWTPHQKVAISRVDMGFPAFSCFQNFATCTGKNTHIRNFWLDKTVRVTKWTKSVNILWFTVKLSNSCLPFSFWPLI